MKRNVRKAYGLVDERGTTFYQFGVMGSEVKSDQTADMNEARRIKEWFRNGIDVGVGSDLKMKGWVYQPLPWS